MATIASMKYLYVPTYWSEQEYADALVVFERSGGAASRVCLSDSVLEAVEGLDKGSALVVSTLGLFGTLEQFVCVLIALQERRIFLQSLNEPWVNEAICDHAYCLEKLKRVLSRVEQQQKPVAFD